jgi:GMP synthase (glutamine-hydrolysing)
MSRRLRRPQFVGGWPLSSTTAHENVVILDFGSQYTQLIARRVREAGVYCEILPYNQSVEDVVRRRPHGLILSGSPASVYDPGAPKLDPELIRRAGCPVLGICYGFQLMSLENGGRVEGSETREYGYARLKILDTTSPLFQNIPAEIDVWMSHGDHVVEPPPGFKVTALTEGALNAAEDLSNRLFGVQFHPEVVHTPLGYEVLRNFLFRVCDLRGDWSPQSEVDALVTRVREQVGEEAHVVCGLSGGVDSTVAAALVHKAIGERQHCIFVDNGLLRASEFETTLSVFREHLNLNVKGVRAEDRFYRALDGIVDPERKRKIIGGLFVDVFEEEAKSIGPDVRFLVQGTLYPDVIESVSVNGPSAVIKSHHNVGGLPEKMSLKLVEPLRELFKDEVRLMGARLDVPQEILSRHPFPGPGLAVRILGAVTPEKVRLLQRADTIFEEELKRAGLYGSVWQAFPVLLPVSSVGVMGDERTYENVLALRAVTSIDGMTADWARLPHDLLARTSSRIISEVRGINRVVYDISSKPPSTIEWE